MTRARVWCHCPPPLWCPQVDYLNSFNAVVSFIKVFKYGRYNQQLSQFVDTVTRAVMQMGSICVVIAVLMVAYSSAFMLAFGYELSDYRDFKTTMFTLFKVHTVSQYWTNSLVLFSRIRRLTGRTFVFTICIYSLMGR